MTKNIFQSNNEYPELGSHALYNTYRFVLSVFRFFFSPNSASRSMYTRVLNRRFFLFGFWFCFVNNPPVTVIILRAGRESSRFSNYLSKPEKRNIFIRFRTLWWYTSTKASSISSKHIPFHLRTLFAIASRFHTVNSSHRTRVARINVIRFITSRLINVNLLFPKQST